MYVFHQILLGQLNQVDSNNRTCSMHGRNEGCVLNFIWQISREEPLVDLVIDGRKILKWMLVK
jgi:hypothetical protein